MPLYLNTCTSRDILAAFHPDHETAFHSLVSAVKAGKEITLVCSCKALLSVKEAQCKKVGLTFNDVATRLDKLGRYNGQE
jgi:hypothetical protein